MLKFFRQIRQRLLNENRFSKYLLYAVGEIFLVVIGILIALQVNNWNEGQKDNHLEQEYYCKLLDDVTQDMLQVEQLIQLTDKRIAASNDLIYLLQSSKYEVDDVMDKTLNAISLITYTFRPSKATFEDLKSSGNLILIRENETKTKIIDYYSTLDGMLDTIDTNADGAVALFYDKEDYANLGWHHLNFVKAGIDTTKVNFKALDPSPFPRAEFENKMTSDAIYYLGANSRIKYLYGIVLEEVLAMKELLEIQCLVDNRI